MKGRECRREDRDECNTNSLLLGRDVLDAAHEDVGHDADGAEEHDQQAKISDEQTTVRLADSPQVRHPRPITILREATEGISTTMG